MADAVLANLGGSERGGGGAVHLDVDADTTILEGDLGYAVNDRFQVFGGARYVDLSTAIELRIGQISPLRASGGASWVDPVVGFRYGTPPGERWRFRLRGDIGGFGVGSDLTWNAVAAVSYSFSQRVSLGLGYRYMAIDYDDGAGADRFLFDAYLDGLVVGAVFSF